MGGKASERGAATAEWRGARGPTGTGTEPQGPPRGRPRHKAEPSSCPPGPGSLSHRGGSPALITVPFLSRPSSARTSGSAYYRGQTQIKPIHGLHPRGTALAYHLGPKMAPALTSLPHPRISACKHQSLGNTLNQTPLGYYSSPTNLQPTSSSQASPQKRGNSTALR